MKHSLVLVLATGLVLLAARATGQPVPLGRAASLLVITHVNVVDVVEGEVLPDRMVVVRDGCIESIGTHAPGGGAVLRLDGSGKYLMPGLWDTHVQAPPIAALEQELLAQLVKRGITSIRYYGVPAGRPALLATMRALEAGTQVGPRVVWASDEPGPAGPYPFHPGRLLDELTALAATGRTPTQVLQAATVDPAAAAGYRYTLGQVAPDFRADLLLLDANPLDDIRSLRQVRAVVLRGRVFDRAALEALKARGPAAAVLVKAKPAPGIRTR
ncbi:amidohydrolase family protein [Hymenobacter jeollabukensis]|nr:amidohydrolase family protein [Hymenobacter jeollabukensis]